MGLNLQEKNSFVESSLLEAAGASYRFYSEFSVSFSFVNLKVL